MCKWDRSYVVKSVILWAPCTPPLLLCACGSDQGVSSQMHIHCMFISSLSIYYSSTFATTSHSFGCFLSSAKPQLDKGESCSMYAQLFQRTFFPRLIWGTCTHMSHPVCTDLILHMQFYWLSESDPPSLCEQETETQYPHISTCMLDTNIPITNVQILGKFISLIGNLSNYILEYSIFI